MSENKKVIIVYGGVPTYVSDLSIYIHSTLRLNGIRLKNILGIGKNYIYKISPEGWAKRLYSYDYFDIQREGIFGEIQWYLNSEECPLIIISTETDGDHKKAVVRGLLDLIEKSGMKKEIHGKPPRYIKSNNN